MGLFNNPGETVDIYPIGFECFKFIDAPINETEEACLVVCYKVEGSGTVHNGLEDFVVENAHYEKRTESNNACLTCLFEAHKNKTGDNKNYSAFTDGCYEFHNGGEPFGVDVVLKELKYGKVKSEN